MKVVSVNVGQPQVLHWNQHTRLSAISKAPVVGKVRVERRQLAGDRQANLQVHGGAYKALYGYPSEYYSFWREHLPELDFPFGSLGENLTTEGLLDETAFIGDYIQIGTAVLAIAQPRMPCSNLQFRFQRSDFIEQFISARRHGFYFSVVEEGNLETGQPMQFVHRDPERVSIADAVSVYYRRAESELAERVRNLESLAPQFKSSLAKRASS